MGRLLRTRLKRHLDARLSRFVGPVARVVTRQPAAAITFDDGPDVEWTPRVLEILDRYGARGTFFMVGRFAAANPSLVHRVGAEGHCVANHSWDHTALPALRRRERGAQIRDCERALAPFGSGMLRPPYGLLNFTVAIHARLLGYQVVKWSVNVGDWWQPDASAMTQELLERVQPGSIVLLHDVLRRSERQDGEPVLQHPPHYDRTPMLRALEAFLAKTGDGIRFVTVPQLLGLGKPVRRGW